MNNVLFRNFVFDAISTEQLENLGPEAFERWTGFYYWR